MDKEKMEEGTVVEVVEATQTLLATVQEETKETVVVVLALVVVTEMLRWWWEERSWSAAIVLKRVLEGVLEWVLK